MRSDAEATREHAAITVADAPFEVVAIEGREAISELFRYEVTCAGGGDPGEMIGEEARITLADGFGAERVIAGVVSEAEERVTDSDHAEIHLVVRPRALRHTLGRMSRVFHDATVIDIVNAVLAEKPRWDVVAKYAPHAYCVQYREDDWTFVSRMLEEEGIHAWFDGPSGALVLSDDSTSAPAALGGETIEYADESGMTRPRETIVTLGHAAEIAPTRFTVTSWSPRNPRLAVKGASGDGALEIHEAEGGGPDSPDECARQARFRREAAACAAATIVGEAHSVRLLPGRVIAIAGHPGRLDGRYLVVESSASIVQRRRGDGGRGQTGYLSRFRLLPANIPYRPKRVTPPARQAGVQLGVVVGERGAEVFPDAEGRVRVQHHWDREGARDERAGTWMRVAQRGTADSMLLPRVGWNVATVNDEGEIDAPSVLSRLHDGEHPPSYPLPATKTRVVYKTATTPGGGSHNEIHFEDQADGERMFWNASKDMAMLVKNDRGEQVVNDARRAVGRDELVDVAANHAIEVLGSRTTKVGNDETVTVSGAEDKTVLGAERSVIGMMRSVKSGGAHQTAVTETRKVEVGAAQIDVTVGPISAGAKTISTLVGGAAVRMTKAGLSDTAGWASVQTIGAVKSETVGGARTTTVKRALVETAAGAIVLDSKKSVTDEASKTSKYHAGAAISAKAPSVHVEAGTKITISVGATSIVVESSQIQVKSASLALSSSSKVVVLAPKVNHN